MVDHDRGGAGFAGHRDLRGAFIAVSLAVLVAALAIVSVTRAAFSSTTANSGNTIAAGSVELVDDDSGSVLFDVQDMVPGDSVQRCIAVTYQGSVADPSAVRMYSGGYTDSGDFGTYLNLTIEEGNGGDFTTCAGFVADSAIESGGTLAEFDGAHADYATGAGAWDPSSTPSSKTYRITVTLDAATPNAEQGESVTDLVFTWEVQS